MVTFVVHTPAPVYQPLAIAIPTPDTPEVKSPIQTVSTWRREKKEELAAFGPDESHVYTSDLECACCEIFIGKDHYEQELYLYPLWQEELKLAKGRLTYDRLVVVRLCGGCARERFGLSEDVQVFDHTVWQQETYISPYRVDQVATLLHQQVGVVLWLTWWLTRHGHSIPPWHHWAQWFSPLVLPERRMHTSTMRPRQERPQTMTQLKQTLASLGTLRTPPSSQVAC